MTEKHDAWVTATLKTDPRTYQPAPSQTSEGQAKRPPGHGRPAQVPDQMPVLEPLQGTITKIHSDPDDPFSPMTDTFEWDGPAFPEPMPKERPSNQLIVKYLQDIPEHAGGRAVGYCQAIQEACEAFQKYATGRIEKLTEPTFGAEALFGALVGVVVTVATGGIGAGAAEGLGKLLADGVKDAIKDTIKDTANKKFKAVQGEDKKASLTRMAEELTEEVKLKGEKVRDKCVSNCTQHTDPLISTLTAGTKARLKPEEEAFILPFVVADSAGADRLFRKLGVPDLGAAKSVKLNLFGQLAMKFESEVADDDSRAETDDLLDELANAKTDGERADINQRLNLVGDHASQNARARAHNAFGAYREKIK